MMTSLSFIDQKKEGNCNRKTSVVDTYQTYPLP